MKFAGKWKKLENIILSEVTQTQKDKHARTSSTRLNKYGENGQPCLVPNFSGIALSFFPIAQILISLSNKNPELDIELIEGGMMDGDVYHFAVKAVWDAIMKTLDSCPQCVSTKAASEPSDSISNLIH
ncbi:hypothetical protein STEG23_026884 [Scotinomys teguina]